MHERPPKSGNLEKEKNIIIQLGRSMENSLGTVQNINVIYDGKLIIDSDTAQGSKLFIVTKEDGTSYVGDIFLPAELQGQGIGIKILQEVANALNITIVPTHIATGGFTSENARKMWEKAGNEIAPNQGK